MLYHYMRTSQFSYRYKAAHECNLRGSSECVTSVVSTHLFSHSLLLSICDHIAQESCTACQWMQHMSDTLTGLTRTLCARIQLFSGNVKEGDPGVKLELVDSYDLPFEPAHRRRDEAKYGANDRVPVRDLRTACNHREFLDPLCLRISSVWHKLFRTPCLHQRHS
jgi:hypothetical protein